RAWARCRTARWWTSRSTAWDACACTCAIRSSAPGTRASAWGRSRPAPRRSGATARASAARGTRRQLDRLLEARRRHLGRQRLAPVSVLRQHALGGAQRVVRAVDAARRAAVAHGLHGLEQEPARLDHRLVGRPQMLARAIDDRPHALLDRAVLHVDALDPREALGLLHLAVEHVVVALVANRAERALVHVEWPVSEAALEPVVVCCGFGIVVVRFLYRCVFV